MENKYEDKYMDFFTSEFFIDLVRAAERLEILEDAYRTMNIYDVEKVMDVFFGIESKYKGGSGE